MAKYVLDQLKSQFDINLAYKLRTAMTRSMRLLYRLEQGKPEEARLYLEKLRYENLELAQWVI